MRQVDHEELRKTIDAAVGCLSSHQAGDGHLPADFGGPLFLLPALLIVDHIVDFEFSKEQRAGFLSYTKKVQNKDGGFGFHQEGPSTVFGTALNYIALRCLGMDAETERAKRAQQWIFNHGGILGIPIWGKVLLAIMNLYDWKGVPSLSPGTWGLPKSIPMHPSRLWCHTRAVYMPMSYLYGYRFQADETTLIRALRHELYDGDSLSSSDQEGNWANIDWVSCQSQIASTDAFVPTGKVASLFSKIVESVAYLDRVTLKGRLKQSGMSIIKKEIQYQDSYTNYLTLNPLSKVLHSLIAYIDHGRDSIAFKAHLERIDHYVGENDLGLSVKDSGCQLWDATFAYQAVAEAACALPPSPQRIRNSDAVAEKLLDGLSVFIASQQLTADPPDYKDHFQEKSKGGWPFSLAEQGWMVSDCTAEAIKCSLVEARRTGLRSHTLLHAVDRILDLQADNGGWSEYEKPRAGRWLESLNSSQLFEKIMISHSHVECTATCMDALTRFNRDVPDYRWSEIAQAVERGLSFLTQIQLPDGAFYGNWGICYTYGTWFGVMGLTAAKVPISDARLFRAISFLLGKQSSEGGWSEDWRNSHHKKWHRIESNYPVQTAWAMMAITSYLSSYDLAQRKESADHELARRCEKAMITASKYLCNVQRKEGDWDQPALVGSTNGTCTLHYENYARVMPLWALAKYRGYLDLKCKHGN